jgi:hypothetical protein
MELELPSSITACWDLGVMLPKGCCSNDLLQVSPAYSVRAATENTGYISVVAQSVQLPTTTEIRSAMRSVMCCKLFRS